MNAIPVDVWEDQREEVYKERERERLESGPSAVMLAKPVTPKYVVSCQGDWYDDQENL